MTCPAVLCEPMCTPTPHNPVTSAGAPFFWEDTVSPWPVEVMIITIIRIVTVNGYFPLSLT